MRRAAAIYIGAALAAFAAGPAGAQLAPKLSDAPVDITGERLEVEGDIATWVGNVRAVQGEAILTAEKLVATLDKENTFHKITAFGTIRYSNGTEAITGGEAVFDDDARTITVSDNVVVTQGDQVMTGGRLIYWVDTGRILFTAPEGKRIRGIFYPKKSEKSDAKRS